MARNIALIGCGAIARNFYLPALSALRTAFGEVWLVDPSDRALSAASTSIDAHTAPHLAEIPGDIHLVVVAAPNHLHFPLAMQALARNADVLIEKPFVIWPDQGRQIVEAAHENNRVVAVNQTRRFFPLAGALRQRVNDGSFGALKSIVHREGTKLSWPFESGVGFTRGAIRTGVIMDFGVHVIDFYHSLFEPRWELVSSIHDGFEGPEGLAEMELLANGVPVSIRLSRYHQQENIARLHFERATVSFDVYDTMSYSIQWGSGASERVSAPAGSDGAQGYQALAHRVLLNFLAASEHREAPVCDAASSLPVIDILDQIYAKAGLYPAMIGAV